MVLPSGDMEDKVREVSFCGPGELGRKALSAILRSLVFILQVNTFPDGEMVDVRPGKANPQGKWG